MPQDVYQVAKISKLLQLIESGEIAQFANKNLEEIDMTNVLEENVDEINDKNEEEMEDPMLIMNNENIENNINMDISNLEKKKTKPAKKSKILHF